LAEQEQRAQRGAREAGRCPLHAAVPPSIPPATLVDCAETLNQNV
jgi:hypothetical protein